MPFLNLLDYTPNGARCIPPFLDLLRSFSHENAYSMHRLSLSRPYNLNTSFSLWTLARPVVLVQLLQRMHRGASTTNVSRNVARRLPHSHAVALLTPPPRFTLTPPLAMTISSTCLLLALLKERYKNNETTKEIHPFSLSLSRCGSPLGLSLA